MTATNTSKPAKDGTGAAFTLEMGAESVSGNIAQKTYLGSPSTEALVEPPTLAAVTAITTALNTPAQDGTDATGVIPPIGAVGIRGWLSGIFNKLNTSIGVTGTFWPATQPVSGTVTANLGALNGAAQDTSVNGLLVAQGSTTFGERGPLVQGAVTTSAPIYTTSQTSPLSLDTAGNLRVNVVTGGSGGTSSNFGSAFPLTGTASGAEYLSSAPILTNGQMVAHQTDVNGNLKINLQTALPAGSATIGTVNLGTLNGAATAAGLTMINTTLGTPAQQTGSTVGLVAGTATIGSIIGRTTMATVTPTVTSNGAYASGNELGGLMTFAVGGAGSGTLMSMRVTSKSVLTTTVQAYVFSANPSNSTWTDKAAPAINAADIASLLCVVPLIPYSGLGTHTIWDAGAIGAQFVAANLYVVLIAVAPATLTSASTTDITVQLGVMDD